MPDPVATGGLPADLAALTGRLPLEVTADLRLQVTAAGGRSTSAHLTGHGRQLQFDVDRPDVLFAAIDRRDAGRLADLLDASGITVRVVGPAGPAATVGAGASSRLGRVVTGSGNVAPVPSAVARLVLSDRARVALAVLLPAGLAALAVALLRRRA